MQTWRAFHHLYPGQIKDSSCHLHTQDPPLRTAAPGQLLARYIHLFHSDTQGSVMDQPAKNKAALGGK